ncbi:MAG: alpha/beta hydrolase [Pseudomonadota bacterium]
MTNLNTLTRRLFLASAVSLAALGAGAPSLEAASVVAVEERAADVKYRSLEVQGVNIAYREAGTPTRPTIVLLHGFPTSSHMFRKLIPELAARYHVIAPDYPGFGASAQPAADRFDYSFTNFADVIDGFLHKKKIAKYALYVMDYGAPVGFRLFAKHPERVTGFVIQNGNAYEEGLKAFWDPLKAYWADPTKARADKLRPFLEMDATKWQWTHGVPKDKLHLVSPDNWIHDQALLDRPGNKDIQLNMFLSYGTNIPEYARWQALFRKHQPPALIVWGKGDHIFPESGAHPYARDLKTVEKHILDTGHFALESHLGFISERILAFLDRNTGS